MKFIILILLFFSSLSFAQVFELKIKNDIYQNQFEEFLAHDDAVAMNIRYEPIKSLRLQLENALNIKLDYFKEWDADGEAHITVITPPEFNVLKTKLSMKELNAIADRYEIQMARLMLLGLGHGKMLIEDKVESTFFLIVDSYQLRTIRQMIFYEFVRRGGDRSAFDPTWFFPHITIGYTKRDLHESDGLLKNIKHSLDTRFNLKTVP